MRIQQTRNEPVYRPGQSDPLTIVILLPTWLGDFVMATPALRAVRERFPTARITFVLEQNLVDLARGGSWMDEMVTLPGREKRTVFSGEYRTFVRSLRRRHFDCAV